MWLRTGRGEKVAVLYQRIELCDQGFSKRKTFLNSSYCLDGDFYSSNLNLYGFVLPFALAGSLTINNSDFSSFIKGL